MANYDFIIPVSYNQQDNNSNISKTYFTIKDCKDFSEVNNSCLGYNFNKCPNDDSYCQPYIAGDIIYFQVLINSNKYNISNTDVRVFGSNGEEAASDVSWTYGYDDKLNTFFTVRLDTTENLPSDCFYIQLNLYDDGFNDYITSEPFCVVKCNEETLLLEGVYNDHDCEGNYYGAYQEPLFQPFTNNFTPLYRVRGVVEPNGYIFEETSNATRKVKSKQQKKFLFRTEKIPYFVAKQIAIVLNSKKFTIDGVEYKGSLKLDKSFDEGSEWIIEETITIDCPEINFTCS